MQLAAAHCPNERTFDLKSAARQIHQTPSQLHYDLHPASAAVFVNSLLDGELKFRNASAEAFSQQLAVYGKSVSKQ